jgi:hypothetical protein
VYEIEMKRVGLRTRQVRDASQDAWQAMLNA